MGFSVGRGKQMLTSVTGRTAFVHRWNLTPPHNSANSQIRTFTTDTRQAPPYHRHIQQPNFSGSKCRFTRPLQIATIPCSAIHCAVKYEFRRAGSSKECGARGRAESDKAYRSIFSALCHSGAHGWRYSAGQPHS